MRAVRLRIWRRAPGSGVPAALALLGLAYAYTFSGLGASLIRAAVETTPPLMFAALRGALTASLFLAVFGARGKLRLPAWADAPAFLATGVLSFAVSHLLVATALVTTTASQASLVQAAGPVLTATFGAVLLMERPPRVQVVSLGLSLLGTILMSEPLATLTQAGRATLSGNLLVLLAISADALAVVLAKGLRRRYDAPMVATWTYSIGALSLLLVALWQYQGVGLARLSPQGALAVGYMGIMVGFFGYLAWIWAMGHSTVVVAGSVMYIQPLAGVAGGIVLLGETLNLWVVLGGSLVLAGLTLFLWSISPRSRQVRGAPPEPQASLPANERSAR